MLLRLLFVMTAASVLRFAACRVCSPVSARREPGCCVETAPDEEDTRPNVRFVTKNNCAVITMRAQSLASPSCRSRCRRGGGTASLPWSRIPKRRAVALAVTEAGERSPPPGNSPSMQRTR